MADWGIALQHIQGIYTGSVAGKESAADRGGEATPDCCACVLHIQHFFLLFFQAQNIEEARYLYDQLTPLCPIMVSFCFGRQSRVVNAVFSLLDCGGGG